MSVSGTDHMSTTKIERLAIRVYGRPAPQGSKKLGQYGQLLEQSPYLPAWRAAVKRAVYECYQALGIEPDALPLFRGAVRAVIVFHLDPEQRADGPPDIDKLLRAMFDVLGEPASRRPRESAASYERRNAGRGARVWEDDSRVTAVTATKTQALTAHHMGASIVIEPVTG